MPSTAGNLTFLKLYIHVFEDEKIVMIRNRESGDSVCLFWLWLLTQAAKSNDHGFVRINEATPYEHADLANLFGADLELIENALSTFSTFRMIEEHPRGSDAPGIRITNFWKYQNERALEDIREGNRERQQRYRERKKRVAPAGVEAPDPEQGSRSGYWDFAFALLSGTGKIPGLNAGHLGRVDAEFPQANVKDHIQEIVDELEGLAEPVQNSLQWLRSAAGKLAERNGKGKPGSPT